MMKPIHLCFMTLPTLLCLPAFAQQYPNRAIRIVVGYSPGGGVDVSARAVGKKLSESLGQPIVVENRPGASGNAAAAMVAKSPPDGYTLFMASSIIAFPGLFPNIPFDIHKDLAPISLVAMGPSVLVAHPSLPVHDVKQLVALAKAKPAQVLFGSAGFGTVTHLAMELLMSSGKVTLTHVPYKGGVPSIVGLLSGEVHVLFSSVPGVLAQINGHKVRAIGMSTLKRSSALPNVPTIHEALFPGYNTASWYGLLAPAGTPKSISDLLSTEIGKIMKNNEIRDGFVRGGFEPEGTTPEAFAAFIKSEIVKYDEIIRKANIKPQSD
jgi:tripartite-type tricarboxylate transporter receptor subunit TctC